MQHLLVVYDISDNKTRRIVGEILEGYGIRVNRSVFEVRLKHTNERTKLEYALLREIDPAVDSVRIYPLCRNCIKNATVLGNEPDVFDINGVYFY